MVTGYFQASNASSPRNIMTSLLSLDEIQSECNALFPFGSGFSQAGPAVDRILKWGGWNMNPSRTMFTNGERMCDHLALRNIADASLEQSIRGEL
jgi:hypothetical protein